LQEFQTTLFYYLIYLVIYALVSVYFTFYLQNLFKL